MVEDRSQQKNTAQAGAVSRHFRAMMDMNFPHDQNVVPALDLDVYPINFTLKFEDWSTEMADAYDVSDTKYALVFKKHFPVRLDIVTTLIGFDHGSMQRFFAFGKVTNTRDGQECLAVVLEKIKGISLSQMSEKEGALSEKKIADFQILSQLLGVLKELHLREIVYGMLCPENIYWDQATNRVVLREFISHFPGFLQQPVYESMDVIIADKTAKSPLRYTDDLYALGVTIFSLIVGGPPIRGEMDRFLLASIRIENGSLETMISFVRSKKNLYLSAHLEDVLRGLLVDSSKERWNLRQVERWRNRQDNAIPVLNHHKESIVPFVFDEMEYYSQKALAHAFFRRWNEARKQLKLADLSRWLGVNLKRSDLAERIDDLVAVRDNNVIYTDERIAKVIMILHPEGPLRYKDLSIELDGISNYYADIYHKNDQERLKQFTRLYTEGLVQFLVRQRMTMLHKQEGIKVHWNAHNIKIFLRRKTLGFGHERCLYDLCPYLPCQSELLQGRYIFSIGDLLHNLDQIFEEQKGELDVVDSHVAAFMASKLRIEDDLRLRSMQNFPKIAKNPNLLMTGLLTVAQSQIHSMALTSMTKGMRDKLQTIVDDLHSKTIKKTVQNELDKVENSGDIKAIFKILSNPNYARKDYHGIREAKQQYRLLNYQIGVLERKENIERLAYHFGLRISVSVAYILCALALLYILNQSL